METVIVNGVGFNKDWVASMELVEFLGHPSNSGLWPDEKYSEKRKRLKEAHSLCRGNNEANGNDSGNVPAGKDAESAERSAADYKGYEA